MKQLFAYMDKLGIEYSKTDFGAFYFCNAPKISFCGAFITLGPGAVNTAAWRSLDRYCKRWGYSLRPWGGYPGSTVYRVCRADDWAALEKYAEYQRESVDACEKAIHLRQIGAGYNMTDSEFNEYLRGVMEFYGVEYLNSLKQAA